MPTCCTSPLPCRPACSSRYRAVCIRTYSEEYAREEIEHHQAGPSLDLPDYLPDQTNRRKLDAATSDFSRTHHRYAACSVLTVIPIPIPISVSILISITISSTSPPPLLPLLRRDTLVPGPSLRLWPAVLPVSNLLLLFPYLYRYTYSCTTNPGRASSQTNPQEARPPADRDSAVLGRFGSPRHGCVRERDLTGLGSQGSTDKQAAVSVCLSSCAFWVALSLSPCPARTGVIYRLASAFLLRHQFLPSSFLLTSCPSLPA